MPPKIDAEGFRTILFSFPSKAIEYLYDQYYHILIRVSTRFTKDEGASEEIVQDIFLYLHSQHKRIAKESQQPILPFLIQSVKNKSIRYYHDNLNAMLDRQEYNQRIQEGIDPPLETTMIQQESVREIWKIISGFPRREQQILFMRYEDEMSPVEIAKILNITLKAVERGLTSGNKRLRNNHKRNY